MFPDRTLRVIQETTVHTAHKVPSRSLSRSLRGVYVALSPLTIPVYLSVAPIAGVAITSIAEGDLKDPEALP